MEESLRAGMAAVVVLDARRDPDRLVEMAAEQAELHRGRLRLFTVPTPVPLSIGFNGLASSSPWSVSELRIANATEADRTSARAVCLVSASVPVEHRVLLGSLSHELRQAMTTTAVTHLFIDRGVLRRSPLVRRLLGRWRGMGVEVTVPESAETSSPDRTAGTSSPKEGRGRRGV